MMPKANRAQLQALTALLGMLRHDWDLPGISAALNKAANLGSAADLAIAACRCAANTELRTPALIAQPGAHWQGTTAGQRPLPTFCPDHPGQSAGHCPGCVACAVPRPDYVVVPIRDKARWVPPKPGAPS